MTTETSPLTNAALESFDVERVRADFPILSRTMRGKPLAFLDSAATAQKPLCVIERIERYYREENANIHRGVYELSERATVEYDLARRRVQEFLGAEREEEIIFTRGTTEALNLVANCLGRHTIEPGDEILISAMEHHSNIVPWQMLRDERGAVLRVAPMSEDGDIIVEEYEKLLGPRTKVVALAVSYTHLTLPTMCVV